jgi:hypothetical protein
MGVAAGSALALSAADLVTVFDAAGGDPLRLRLTAIDLKDLPPRDLAGPLAETLPPGTALQLRLPEGSHRVDFTLAPGSAAIADWRRPEAVTIWSGDEAVSRSVEGSFTDLMLVNTGTSPAPATLAWSSTEPQHPLTAGVAFKRFFGAAGSLDLPIDGKGRVFVAGGDATLMDHTGQVSHGPTLALNGAGRLVITHGPGLLAAWIEDGEVSPWPNPTVQKVTLPQRLPLHDMAMSLGFTASTEILLHVRSTAPVILALGKGAPMIFAQGAELHRALPAGTETLRVLSPHDGPLAGTLELSAEPIAPAHEGIGAVVAVAPGGTAAFGFDVARAGPVGVGVRAEPDRVSVKLLTETGTVLGEGIAQLRNLPVGRYVLEAQIPPDATPTELRPTIVGIAPHPNAPPPDVINKYLALAGRIPTPK